MPIPEKRSWLLSKQLLRYWLIWTVGFGGPTVLEAIRAEGMTVWEFLEHAVIFGAGLVVTAVLYRRYSLRLLEQQRLSAALAASEKRWQAALDSAGDGLWEWDAVTNTAYFSPRWKAMLGFRDEEFPNLQAAWMERIHPEDRARVDAAMEAHVQGRVGVYSVEYRMRTKSEVYRWVLARGRITARTPEGRIAHVIGTHTDITERRRLEDELRESRERYRVLLENATDAMVVSRILPDGRYSNFIECNAAACRYTGCTREEMLQRSPTSFLPLPTPELEREFVQKIRTERRVLRELEIVAAGGRKLPVEVHSELFELEGHPTVMTVVRDISTRRAAEARQHKETEQNRILLELYSQAPAMTERQLFDRVIETAVHLTDSEIGFIHRVAEDQETIILTTWNQRALENCTASYETHYPLSRAGNWVDCVREQRPVVYNDFAVSPHQKGLPSGHSVLRRFASVPVIEGGKVRIIFGVGNKPTGYLDDDVARLQVVAAELQKILSRVRAERALADSEASYRELFAGNPNPMWVIDHTSLRFLAVNDAAVRLYGYSREEFLRLTTLDIRPPEERPRLLASLQKGPAGYSFDGTWRHRRKDGGEIFVEVSSQGLPWEGHAARAVLLVDVTARERAMASLERSEAALKTAQRVAGVGNWVWQISADRYEWSDELYRIYGFEPAAGGVTAAALARVIHPVDLAGVEGAFRAMAATGRLISMEYRILWPDGTVRFLWTEAGILQRDAEGRPVEASGITQDITARKEAEIALRASEQRYRVLIENVAFPVTVTSLGSGRVLFANRHAIQFFGLGDTAVIGRRAADFWVDPALRAELVDEILAGREVVGREVAMRTAQGKAVWVQVSASRIEFDGQLAIFGVQNDITLRKQAEDALRLRERELDLFFSQSLDGFFFMMLDVPVVWNDTVDQEAVLDYVFAHQRITRANDALLAQYGASREELLGRTPGDLKAHDLEAGREIWRQLFDAGRLHVEMDERKRDGTTVWIEGDFICLHDEQGRITGHFGAQRDITQRKHAEAELLRTQERVVRAMEIGRMGGWELDHERGEFTFSDQIYELYGTTAAREGGYRMAAETFAREFVFADDVHTVAREMERLRNNPKPGSEWSFEARIRRRDGEIRDVQVRITVISDVAGRVVGARGVNIDITERKRSERALRTSEERFRGLFDFSPIGIFEEDFSAVKARIEELRAAGHQDLAAYFDAHPDEVGAMAGRVRVLLANQRSAEILGAPSSDAVCLDLPRYFTARSLVVFRDELLALARGEHRFHAEIPVINAIGEERLFDIVVNLQPGSETSWDRAVVSFFDITERVRGEAERRKLSRAVEQSPVSIVITDTSGAIEYVNPQFTRVTGYAPFEVVGQNPRVLKSGVQPDTIYRDMWAALCAGREWHGELCNRRKDGTHFWEDASISPLFDETGKITHFLAIKEDTTARREAHAALQRSEQRFRSLAESLPNIAVQGYDRDRRVVFWNPASTVLYGYTREEAIGQRLEDLIIPTEMKDGVVAAIEGWINHGVAIPAGEMVLQRKDGSPVTVFSTHVMLQQSSGEYELHCVDIDLTERKAAEAQVREHAALLDVTRDAVILVDTAGLVRFWNRGAEGMYGWTSEEMLGRNLHDFLYDETRPAPLAIRRLILENGNWSGELTQRTKSGTTVLAQARGVLMRDAAGEPRSILLTASDITEAKRMEAQFLRAQRLESLGALASGVAHDLNNVLSPIMMSVELLRPLAVTPDDREVLRLLSDSTRRGADVVRQLLLFGRGAETPAESMDVAQVVLEILRMTRETFPRNLTITGQTPHDLWSVRTYATQIYQILLNLCVNARDAMPTGGRLTVDARNVHLDADTARCNPGAQPGRHVELRVADTGAGIPANIIDRIFDPFFTTKEQGKGTGLGLSTVVGIAKSLGGFVTVSSRVGYGSEFRVYLPALEGSAGEDAPAEAESAWKGRGELVLIVDDEASIRNVLGRSLSDHGFRVVTGSDGAEGIRLATAHRAEVRVAVLDMMMPGLDGPDIVRALRKLIPSLPIIACSGLERYRDELAALGYARLNFLRKPFTALQLRNALRQVLENPPAPPGPNP